MQRLFLLLVVLCLVTSCGNVYYIVRHAEKATPSPGPTMMTTNDPPLSHEGELRAKALAELLKNKNIARIFTTNTIRTKATVAPVANYFKIEPELYSVAGEGFISKLKSINKNTLIVGHSNTVDDLVNMLTGEAHLSDLPDSAYSNIYIVIRKGNRFQLKQSSFEAFK
jgi:broad specificity phosphatase PhoE